MIAEAVNGLEASTLVRVCQVDLLDSALHAPQAGFGDDDFYPGFVRKAAVLVVRIVGNHSLPDGNKRLAWQALTMYCALNHHELHVAVDDAVMTMQAIAASDLDEAAVATWLNEHLDD